jgi:RNA polymerase sigma factor (sigma-70 family)
VSTDESDGIDAIEAAFSAGDEGALKGAYEAYGSLVYTFCRRLVGKAQAEGVTKDVFVGAWQDRARFDSDVMSLAGWLMAIARSRIRDNMRLHCRLSEDTDAEAIRIGDRMLLANALQALPERTSTAVDLALIAGLNHREIAQRTGLPLETFEREVRRGVERIRRDLVPRAA